MKSLLLLLLCLSQVQDSAGPPEIPARPLQEKEAQLPPRQAGGESDAATSPTPAERIAAAKLVPRGVTIQVDDSFAITSLTYNYREGAAATDEDLQLIASLPALKRLYLSGPEVTDAGLSRLHSLKTLTSLTLRRTSVTEEAITAFNKAVPDCRVIKSFVRPGVGTAAVENGFRQLPPISSSSTEFGRLLLDHTVQRELKLTEEQLAVISETLNKSRQQPDTSKLFQRLQAARTNEDRSAIMEEIRATRRDAETKADTAIREQLTAVQFLRLEQLVLQQRGPQAFADDDIATALNLTEEQRRRIREYMADASRPRGFQNRSGQNLSHAVVPKLFSVLTPEQKEKWHSLLGLVLPRSPSPIRGQTPAQTASHWFQRFDRNSDDQLASEEWSRSSVIRREFINHGLDLSKPMSREQFVEHYLRIRHAD